ncbi:MAG TPA: sulfite exporter TauE/SafE family protein [Candidatus Obscuribacterales bacterium]
MLDLGLIAALGFLGSFGHCVGMCGPIAVAFALTTQPASPPDAPSSPRRQPQWQFHLLLNLGRLLSYMAVGAAIGGVGSVLMAGGQMAGVGSLLRRSMALLTGSLLIWLGLRQVAPQLLPRLPLPHPVQGWLHQRLQQVMTRAAQTPHWGTPLLLGLAWGLVPCGFLYAAQIKAAATSSPWGGALTMLAFGSGTLPMMIGLGTYSAWLSRDRTSQLFQLGGWLTLLIGVLTLMRTGDLMIDYTGHLALLCLALSLIARPICKLWAYPYRCRRLLGVGAGVLAIAHTLHMLEHSWNWQLAAVQFMLPQHQWGMVAGGAGLALMVPLTLTSNDFAQRQLGAAWRSLHRLSLPAFGLCTVHCLLSGSTYLGNMSWSPSTLLPTALLGGGVGLVLAVRSPLVWRLCGLSQWYTPPQTRPVAIPASRPHC